MKYTKIIVPLVVVCIWSILILVGVYSVTNGFGSQNTVAGDAPEPLPLQIHSPQENATYQTYSPPLNITTNNATAKIIYNLNGKENITYTKETTNIPKLRFIGTYNLTVYAFDSEENIIDYKTITFAIDGLHMTQQEFQETISYFESQGLTIEFPKPDVFLVVYNLRETTVEIESKEELADFAKTQGIDTIMQYEEIMPCEEGSQYVTFRVYTYPNPPLPVIYHFLVKII